MKGYKVVFFLFIIFISLSKVAHAYKMVMVQGISKNKKTFYVRLGIQDGINTGMEATFTSDNLSLVARALEVTRFYSLWRIVEPKADFPFQKEQVVTFNYATEKVWLMDPDDYLSIRKKISEEDGRQFVDIHRREYPDILSIGLFTFGGISQSVSRANSEEITARQGAGMSFLYHHNSKSGLLFGGGFRYEYETIYSEAINIPSKRMYLLLNLSYAFHISNKYPQFLSYIGTTLGYGRSETEVAGHKLTGWAQIVPAFSIGIEYFFIKGLGLRLEGGVESIAIKETFADGTPQETSETNYKIGTLLSFYL